MERGSKFSRSFCFTVQAITATLKFMNTARRRSQTGKKGSSSPISAARQLALNVVLRSHSSASFIDEILHKELSKNYLIPEDRRLAQELVYGSTRMRGRIDIVLNHRLPKGLASLPDRVVAILRLAVYEILFLNQIPTYATTSEAMKLTNACRQTRGLKNLVNGVLRAIIRNSNQPQPPDLHEDLLGYLECVESHPRILLERWIELWGEERTIQLCRAGNTRPDLYLRVMLSKTTRENVMNDLQSAGIQCEPSDYHPCAIRVSGAVTLGNLDPLRNGLIQVQDLSSMFVAPLLAPKPGESFWDVCAAPGGKTTHLADLCMEAIILATDKNTKRVDLLRESVQRLALQNVEVDVCDPLKHQIPGSIETKFDGILLDVPCTGWGTLARRPDLRWRICLDDGPRLAEQATMLLNRCWLQLRKGGRLVYSTCTLNPEENDEVIDRFLRKHPDAVLHAVDEYVPERSRSMVVDYGRLRIWPGMISTDGIFACRIDKTVE